MKEKEDKEWFEHEYIESGLFESAIKKLCTSEQEESQIKNYVAHNRQRGDGVGKSGIKKIRVPIQGKGTRGGGRVIFYYSDDTDSFMLIYSKAKQEDLTHKEQNLLELVLKKELEDRKRGNRNGECGDNKRRTVRAVGKRSGRR